MQVTACSHEGKRIVFDLDMVEAGHLLSFLLHAKFSDDVRLELVGSPTMQALLSGLIQAGQDLDERDLWRGSDAWDIREEGGLRAPPSFQMIEDELKSRLAKDDVTTELQEYLYPFRWTKAADLKPGV